MIGFRENEEKNVVFFCPPTKSRKGSPYLHNFFSSALKSLRSVQIPILKPKKYPRSSKNLSVL